MESDETILTSPGEDPGEVNPGTGGQNLVRIIVTLSRNGDGNTKAVITTVKEPGVKEDIAQLMAAVALLTNVLNKDPGFRERDNVLSVISLLTKSVYAAAGKLH